MPAPWGCSRAVRRRACLVSARFPLPVCFRPVGLWGLAVTPRPPARMASRPDLLITSLLSLPFSATRPRLTRLARLVFKAPPFRLVPSGSGRIAPPDRDAAAFRIWHWVLLSLLMMGLLGVLRRGHRGASTPSGPAGDAGRGAGSGRPSCRPPCMLDMRRKSSRKSAETNAYAEPLDRTNSAFDSAVAISHRTGMEASV